MKFLIVDHGMVVGQSDDRQMAAVQLAARGRGVLAEVVEVCISDFLSDFVASRVLSEVLSEDDIQKPLSIRPKRRNR